jgi:putative copper resistance protein D
VAGGAMIVLGIATVVVWHNRPPAWSRGVSTSVGLSAAFALTAGAVLLFGVDAHEGDLPRTNPISATGESIAIGEQLYMQNCMSCHGEDGKGGPQAADLTVHVPAHGDGSLFAFITQGYPPEEPRMPSFRDELTDEERWHVVNFLRATWDTGDLNPVLPPDLASSDAGD